MEERQRGRPLAVDRNAKSASDSEPAFISPPKGAPAYYGFVVVEDVIVDGFTLGKITDWEVEPCNEGDAFVIAPDGSRAGLVWEVGQTYFQEVLAFETARWGVWGVGLPMAMSSKENARMNLEFLLPQLKSKWIEWKAWMQARNVQAD